MWNSRDQEDDSWEVRAFAEDTSNIMGTTWPPRSYACTFCRREFRSAQALGGHMNVHRRDRARLHQASPINNNNNHRHRHPISSLSRSHHSPSFLNLPHSPEPFANGGVCLLYPFPSPNTAPFSPLGHTPTFNNACADSPSSLFALSSSLSHPPMGLPNGSFDFSVAQPATAGRRSLFSSFSGKGEQEPATSSAHHGQLEELDLELRLGNRSTSTS